MPLPEDIALYFAPDDVIVEAQIVELTPALFDTAMGRHWWNDRCVKVDAKNPPIDIDWDWAVPVGSVENPILCYRVAVVTGDGQVQGAMVVDVSPVPSAIDSGEECLQVDQICTAPRNRWKLRRDNRMWYKGVGTQLLRWAARLSMDAGCRGKLRLLASPEGVDTYKRLGFVELKLVAVIDDGIEYKPMELPLAAVQAFLIV